MKKTIQEHLLIFTLFTCTGSYVLAPVEAVESPEVTDAKADLAKKTQDFKDRINIIREQKEKLDEIERNTDKNDPAALQRLDALKKQFQENAKEAIKMHHDFINRSGIKLDLAKKDSPSKSLSKSATTQPDAGITAMSFEAIVTETPLEKAQRHYDAATKDLSRQETYLKNDKNPSNKEHYEENIEKAKAAIAKAKIELTEAQPKSIAQRMKEKLQKLKDKLSTKKPSPEDSKQPTKKEGRSWVDRMKERFQSKPSIDSSDASNWVSMNPAINP